MSSFALLLGALVPLVGGAELLVRGATGLAERFHVSSLIVGLTVVAFGTSSPELIVSLTGVFSGQSGIAAGNAVGSNTFNVLFILGLSAIIRPLVVERAFVRIHVPIMIGVSVLLWGLSLDGLLGRLDGFVLLAGLVAYVLGSVVAARATGDGTHREENRATPDTSHGPSIGRSSALTITGLTLAILGGRWFVMGAVGVAANFGVSESVIGLTIVAAGTSLPELATSVVAAIRGQRDIAVGNVIGSNIFNLLGILGIAGVVAPGGLLIPPAIMAFDLPVMLAASLACLPVLFTGHEIRRWEGGLLLAAYLSYVTYLALAAGDHDALSGFSLVMVWFALPVACLGIGGSLLASFWPKKD
jgi:cation:H+ antiporter